MIIIKSILRPLAVAQFFLGALAAHGQATINITGLSVTDSSGNALVDGRLIQLIASTTDTVFSAPTSSGFVSGDDRVIASFALDSSGVGIAGAFQSRLVINASDFSGLTSGDSLLLRWFDVPYTPVQTAPGETFFGEFQGVAGIDSSDAWIMPGPGNEVSLTFVTTDHMGSQPTSASRASFSTSPIPEPSTYAALFGAAVLGFAAYRRRVKSNV